jgi:hypothetical protein
MTNLLIVNLSELIGLLNEEDYATELLSRLINQLAN